MDKPNPTNDQSSSPVQVSVNPTTSPSTISPSQAPNRASTSHNKTKRSTKIISAVLISMGLILVCLVVFAIASFFISSNQACNNFASSVENSFKLPAGYKIVDRKYGDCGNTLEGYSNKVSFVIQSSERGQSFELVRDQLSEYLKSQEWIITPDENSFSLDLKYPGDNEITGHATISAITPNTININLTSKLSR